MAFFTGLCRDAYKKKLANVNVHTAFEVDFAFSIIFTVTYNFCLRCLSEQPLGGGGPP